MIQKNRRFSYDCSNLNLLFFFFEYAKYSENVGESSMYTLDSPYFVFRKFLLRRVFPVSIQNVCTFCLIIFSNHHTVRFFLWWLSLHRRLRFRQRGSSREVLSDFCSFLVVPCQKVLFVFIQITSKSFSTFFEQSLSASIQGVMTITSAFIVLKQCVTAFVCLSLYRSNARKLFRL